MRKFTLVEFSLRHPKLVIALTLIVTLLFATQFPKITVDTNPKNMLPPTSEVRVWNAQVEKTFGLYEDMIVVGVQHDQGVLNRQTLGNIKTITEQILALNGVASRDVASFTTIDNVTASADGLRVAPLLKDVPRNEQEFAALSKMLFDNNLFVDRIISRDGKTAAIYVPLEKGANGKEIADEIKTIVAKQQGGEQYYVAGDPVARDTFGAEMFKLMGMFSPVAGFIMFVAIFLMFRNLSLAMIMMAVAMVSIIWSMGLLIGLGYPVHIMSSMAPVFLMAIATDSIHIFNEFYFRFRETKDKATAIRETLAAVGRPVKYTALATAAGFAVLLFMQIIPVKVFGGVIVFGTVVLRLLSFSLIPAILLFLDPKKIEKAAQREVADGAKPGRLLEKLASYGIHAPKSTVLVGLALLAVSVVGMTRLVVNNNQVEWFSKNSEVRVADEKLNAALGGTASGYIVAVAPKPDYIKTPEAMRYIDGLQRHLEQMPEVGKTFSIVDYVKRINRVLHEDNPRFSTVPDSAETIGQYIFLFGMSAKQSDLDNVVDYPFQQANIWIQLKTWDAQAMDKVSAAIAAYNRAHPTPMQFKPAGTAHFNNVWNQEVLWDMVKGFALALVVVFAILVVNFRSVRWAVVSYVPLLFTICLIYGVIGFAGKDFDMPISVLSCLSLGMAVDFSIHFVSRLRQRLSEQNTIATPDRATLQDALLWTAARPGKGIMRNAILFAAAFAVMMLAPLTPYITVGAFILSMMMLSALTTLVYLPALVVLGRTWLFPSKKHATTDSYTSTQTLGEKA